MEANLVVKASDLTPAFADGIRLVFSPDAVLKIRVEYGTGTPKVSTEAVVEAIEEAAVVIKRGRKPGAVKGAKRGPKPGAKAKAAPAGDAPKKRGRKPKAAIENLADITGAVIEA